MHHFLIKTEVFKIWGSIEDYLNNQILSHFQVAHTVFPEDQWAKNPDKWKVDRATENF